MDLRLLAATDAEAAVDLRRLALTTDADAFAERPESDPALNLEFVRERLAASSIETGAVVIGAFALRLIGVVGLNRVTDTSDAARLWGFYVEPMQRTKGVGRALLDAALDCATQMSGVVRVELSVSERSMAAIRLYEVVGFATSATVDGKRHMMYALHERGN